MTTTKSVAAQDAIRGRIREGAELNIPYLLMNTLAATIASYGLFANSASAVIGAMIIAMLLGPVAGTALALVDGDTGGLIKALGSLLAGIGCVIAISLVLGFVHADIPLTDEIMARTTPNLRDLMIALAGGAAGAYATISPRLSAGVVGVAIATAMVPPLCAGSILFTRGPFSLGLGAWLLTFTNIVAIQFASSVVLWLSGFHRIVPVAGSGFTSFLRSNMISLVVLILLTIVMTANLRHDVQTQVFENRVRETLQGAIDKTAGRYLSEVRFAAGEKGTIIRAIVRGPKAPTPGEVATLATSLPAAPDGKPLDLRVRFVFTQTITPTGLLYQDEAVGEGR